MAVAFFRADLAWRRIVEPAACTAHRPRPLAAARAEAAKAASSFPRSGGGAAVVRGSVTARNREASGIRSTSRLVDRIPKASLLRAVTLPDYGGTTT